MYRDGIRFVMLASAVSLGLVSTVQADPLVDGATIVQVGSEANDIGDEYFHLRVDGGTGPCRDERIEFRRSNTNADAAAMAHRIALAAFLAGKRVRIWTAKSGTACTDATMIRMSN